MRYRPSKAAAAEYAAKMQEVEDYIAAHGIEASLSRDSYYFTVRGQAYRVSNHSVEASDAGAYDWLGNQVRPLYHGGRDSSVIYIHAGKTRIIEIHQALLSGIELDGRGRIGAAK